MTYINIKNSKESTPRKTVRATKLIQHICRFTKSTYKSQMYFPYAMSNPKLNGEKKTVPPTCNSIEKKKNTVQK